MTISEHWRFLGDRVARALHLLGEHERELEEVLRFRERWPDNQGFFLNEIRARAALRQPRRVEELVEEAIQRGWPPLFTVLRAGEELRAHGEAEAARSVYRRGMDFLDHLPAETQDSLFFLQQRFLLLDHLGRYEEAAAVTGELLQRDSSNPLYLAFQAATVARLGQREEALRIEARLADSGAIGTYDRACIAAALGDESRAMVLLEQALAEGHPFNVGFHTDPSLEPLWDYPPFQLLLEPKG